MALVLRERFRFLDFPSEIRNKIYRYSLSAAVSKRTYFKCHFQLLLLRVSRQVRAEAEHIFRNYNPFVLVKINLDISSVFYTLLRPTVLAWYDRAQSFRHHAIALDLSLSPFTSFVRPDLLLLPETQQYSTASCLMIAGEDIPWLVRALSTIDGVYESLGCQLLPHTYLFISPLGPLKDATTREEDDLRLRKLLKPFYRQGIWEACLDASVSADYAYRIAEKIQPAVS